MDTGTSTPRLVSNNFVEVILPNYVINVNLSPTMILRTGLLIHKLRYSVTALSKEMSDDKFFQMEVFKSAPKLDEVLPLFQFVADKGMIFASTRRIREQALAVIKYTAELAFSCILDPKVKNLIPTMELIATQFDAKNSAIAFVVGDVNIYTDEDAVGNGGKGIKLRLGLMQIQSSLQWRELVNGNPKRVQEAKSLIFWLVLHAKQNSLENIGQLNLAKTTFWKRALTIQQTDSNLQRKRKLAASDQD